MTELRRPMIGDRTGPILSAVLLVGAVVLLVLADAVSLRLSAGLVALSAALGLALTALRRRDRWPR